MNRGGSEGFCIIAHSLKIVKIFLEPSTFLRPIAPVESIDIANNLQVDDKLISMSVYLFSKLSDY